MQNEPFLNEQAFQLWTLVRFFMIKIWKFLYRMFNYIYWSSNIHTGCENRKIAASDRIVFSGYIGGRPIRRRTAINPSESSRIAIRRKNWLWKSFYSSIDFGRWKRPWDFSWSIFSWSEEPNMIKWALEITNYTWTYRNICLSDTACWLQYRKNKFWLRIP